MQRCLQEGGESNSDRELSSRRSGASRRARPDDSTAIDIQQLQLFWKGLPPEQRPALCCVSAADFEKSVASLASLPPASPSSSVASLAIAAAAAPASEAPQLCTPTAIIQRHLQSALRAGFARDRGVLYGAERAAAARAAHARMQMQHPIRWRAAPERAPPRLVRA